MLKEAKRGVEAMHVAISHKARKCAALIMTSNDRMRVKAYKPASIPRLPAREKLLSRFTAAGKRSRALTGVPSGSYTVRPALPHTTSGNQCIMVTSKQSITHAIHCITAKHRCHSTTAPAAAKPEKYGSRKGI